MKSFRKLIFIGLVAWTSTQSPIFAQPLQYSNEEIKISIDPVNSNESFYTRVNASMCAQCHGSEGVSVQGANIPSIAGKGAEEMIAKFKNYKVAEPTSSVMARLARGLSEEQIINTVNYYASLKNSESTAK